MKVFLDNLPASLQAQREVLVRCLETMNLVVPLQAVYLFGSHARGDARLDSDVDLCLVVEGAERQLETAQKLRRAMRPIWPKPAFTLVPISPARLAELLKAELIRSGWFLEKTHDLDRLLGHLKSRGSDLVPVAGS